MSAPSEADGLLEHLVFEIAEGMSGQTGEAFFHSLVRRLATALEADFVLVAPCSRAASESQRWRPMAMARKSPTLEYDLAGTPCANVVEKRLCSYPSGIQQMFPQDLMLAQMGAEGYVGSPMIDSSGRCLGLVCALTRRPLQHPKLAETLLQTFRHSRRRGTGAQELRRRSRRQRKTSARPGDARNRGRHARRVRTARFRWICPKTSRSN